jgi:hypothetical protein
LPSLLLGLANAHGKADQPIVGLKHLDEAARRVEETEHRLMETDMHRIREELPPVLKEAKALLDELT